MEVRPDERQSRIKLHVTLAQTLCSMNGNVTAATHAQVVTLQVRLAASLAEGSSAECTLIKASLAAAAAAEEPLG